MDVLQALDWSVLRAVTAVNADNNFIILSNKALETIIEVNLFKMGPLVLLLLYSWFISGNKSSGGVLPDPELVIRGTLGILLAIAIGRLSQEGLPARPRPRYALQDLPFPALADDTFHDWSSFPSDHAVMVGALVTVVWARSRPLGLMAAAWGALFVCFPRIYFGLHYVSDVLGGAAIGAALMGVVLWMPLPRSAWDWLRRLEARSPALVVLGLFLLGWELIELFETARRLVPAVAKAVRVINGDAT